jgi:hypothetical protein
VPVRSACFLDLLLELLVLSAQLPVLVEHRSDLRWPLRACVYVYDRVLSMYRIRGQQSQQKKQFCVFRATGGHRWHSS